MKGGSGWEPSTHAEGVACAVAALICWGTWSNALKVCGVRWELFYVDYVLACVFASLLAAASLGPPSALSLTSVPVRQAGYALAAGVVFNIANLLVTLAITLIGMATAFPLSIGTALAVGAALNYALAPKGSLLLLSAGCVLALAAVGCMGGAYAAYGRSRRKQRQSETLGSADPLLQTPDEGGSGGEKTAMSLQAKVGLCVGAGILMGSWSPLCVSSMNGAEGISAYEAMILFTLGMVISSCVALPAVARWPVEHGLPPLSVGALGLAWVNRSTMVSHLAGVVGGGMWFVGTLMSLISGPKLGFAVSYSIGQCAPLAAAIWGIFLWREFAHADLLTVAALTGVFLFYGGAIASLALSS